jgi:glycosyltransferase involved in cell wall biosynthesis
MTVPKNPLVSVIIPVFNGQQFVREAIESVYSQTYKPVELIVVDDGSSDGSRDVIQSYTEIHFLKQENHGPASARNLGIKHSTGQLIAFLDQDDIWTKDKLETQVAFMQAHPEIGYTLAKQKVFFAHETTPPEALLRWKERNTTGNIQTGYLPSTLVIRKELFEKLGYFDPTFICTSDFDFFFRLKDANISMQVIDRVLLHKRFHDHNQCYDTALGKRETARLIYNSFQRCRKTKE